MKKSLKVILIISLIIFIFWGIPMLKCEYLTIRHGHEFDFKQVPEENTMLGKPEWFRILSYNDEIAKIYYIDGYTGNTLLFKKFDEKWEYDRWERTLWSSYGNADENIWPYFWHSIKYDKNI